MNAERVYADATTLIGLARIDRLDLLALLPTPILVTTHVWAEVASDTRKPGTTALIAAEASSLIAIVAEGDPHAFRELDPGESTVLSAAAATQAEVLVDERKARALLKSDPGLRVAIPRTIGVIGLLLLSKSVGMDDTIKPILDALIRERFWIKAELYDAILRQVGED